MARTMFPQHRFFNITRQLHHLILSSSFRAGSWHPSQLAPKRHLLTFNPNLLDLGYFPLVRSTLEVGGKLSGFLISWRWSHFHIFEISQISQWIWIFSTVSMTNIITQVSQIVSAVLFFCKNTWASILAALNFSKYFNTDSLPCWCAAEVVLYSPKAWTKIKCFQTSLIRSAVLLLSHLIAFCFFVASKFIVISPMMLFYTCISIITRSVSVAVSSILPPIQA